LTITVPGTEHNLIVEQRGPMNAPRVLHEVEGDFVLQVRVSGNFPAGAKGVTDQRKPFHGAGLLIYQDDRTYVRLERAELNLDGAQHHYVNWELRQAGACTRAGGPRDGAIDGGAPVWLRLERRGARVYGYHGTDGVTWTALEPIEVRLPRRVYVGVSATQNTSTGFAPVFEGLQLYRAVVSLPPPVDASPRAAVRWDLTTHAVTFTPSWNLLRLRTTTWSGSPVLLSGALDTATPPQGIPQPAKPDPRARFKVGEIKILGSTQIAEDAIRERLGLTPGQVVTPADVRRAEQKLRDSGIFKRAPAVTAVDPPAGEFKTIVVTIPEK
jgi:regulation of enolase protein 1 (concanavalin A-like superfamily)